MSKLFEYAPAPESLRPEIKDKYNLFINNEFIKPSSGKYMKSINPTSEDVLTRFAIAGKKDVQNAVNAAKKAHKKWSSLPGIERTKYLYTISRIMQERSREFAVAESLDSGKPIKEARDVDVPLAAQHFSYYAGWSDKVEYLFPGENNLASRGVVGAIIPWNFPLLMLAWKVAPALSAGNTIVLKPAETTSLTALMFAEVVLEARLPAGVVNIITGAGETGAALVSSNVDKIAFTGSTSVGKIIAKSAEERDIPTTMELGGKSPNIIFDDAPLDQVVEKIIDSIFFNMGQVCCAGSRLIVEENIHDELLSRLKDRLSTIRVGDPLDKNTDIGPINSREQLEIISSFVKTAKKEGVNVYQPDCPIPSTGYYHLPILLSGVTTSNTVFKEEIFGPVLSITTFRTPDEAVELANNTEYGLAAGVFTTDQSKVFGIASKIRAGVVWANTYNKFDPASPFGGYKESGYGREGGVHGLHPYVKRGDK